MFDAVDTDRGEAPPAHAGRRHLSERQAEVMERLIAAAAAEAEERPYAEIAEIELVSEQVIRKRVSRALKALRTRIGEQQ